MLVTPEEVSKAYSVIDTIIQKALDNEIDFMDEKVNKFFLVAQELACERDMLVEKAERLAGVIERDAKVITQKLKAKGAAASLSFNDVSSSAMELKLVMEKLEWLRVQAFSFSELVRVAFPNL